VIVLDTTVLVYAVGDEHPLRAPCRALVDAIGRERVQATTTIEVVQEFAHVRARRRGRDDAVSLARQFAGLLQPLIVVDERDLHDGLDIFAECEGLGAFDAVLAAAALRRGACALVSADRSFAAVPRLVAVDPLSPEAEALLP
jgi:uncharacterized protein